MPAPFTSPLIVHHMAALDGSPFPPNSLEAIRACLDADAAFVEVDITALADGDYLLVHEATLEPETDGAGPVGACSLRAARQLHIRTVRGVTPFRAPMLGDVVELMLSHPAQTRLQLDFKNMTPFASAEPLERLARMVEPLARRVIVSSAADWQLRKLRAIAPWLDLGLDIHFYIAWSAPGEVRSPGEHPRALGAYGYWDDHPIATQPIWSTAEYLCDRCEMLTSLAPGVSTFYINHRFLAQSLADGFDWATALRTRGIRSDAWTMDIGKPAAEACLPLLLAAGVDQITSNTPLTLAKMIDELRVRDT